jgi:hypothetical protein
MTKLKVLLVGITLLWATPTSAVDDPELSFYQITTPCKVAGYVPMQINNKNITPEIWICKDGRAFRTKRGREELWQNGPE